MIDDIILWGLAGFGLGLGSGFGLAVMLRVMMGVYAMIPKNSGSHWRVDF